MPFNMALISGGRRVYTVAIEAEDLSANFNVESEVISAYGISGTRADDLIILNVAAVNVVAANASVYAIDAHGLHDDAELRIVLTAGALISGRGGKGGNGGLGFWNSELGVDESNPGLVGFDGGTAIRYGCDTNIIGTGTITKGYGGGGGGGGGSSSSSSAHGGGGGGGGVPFGAGGSGGYGLNGSGSAGSAATVSALGAGGAAGGANAGAGGDGGESGTAQQAGDSGTKAGGSAGSDGDAIDTQGFTHSAGGSVTITGSVV